MVIIDRGKRSGNVQKLKETKIRKERLKIE